MRSIIGCEHDHPFRFAKYFFRSGIFEVAIPAPIEIEDENGTVFERDLDWLAGFGASVENSLIRFLRGSSDLFKNSWRDNQLCRSYFCPYRFQGVEHIAFPLCLI